MPFEKVETMETRSRCKDQRWTGVSEEYTKRLDAGDVWNRFVKIVIVFFPGAQKNQCRGYIFVDGVRTGWNKVDYLVWFREFS
jgi:hypothetical protein